MELNVRITARSKIHLILKETSKVKELEIINNDANEEYLTITAEGKSQINFKTTDKVKELEMISIHINEFDNN